MKNILITGTSGYVGAQLVERLKDANFDRADQIGEIVALDVRDNGNRVEGVHYYFEDIRKKDKLAEIFKKHDINTVIHLAAVLAPSPKLPVDTMYEINVDGTRNLLECAYHNKCERFLAASSGAAYGYYPESVNWLTEDDPIRGNFEFPYSLHKRINEEDFATYRTVMPEMKQFIFRIGTVLGENVNNLITDLFKKPVVTGLNDADTPFVFIWDEDLVQVFIEGVFSNKPGCYNVAGDDAVNLRDIAKKLKKRFVPIPSGMIEKGLTVFKGLGLSQYGPEQVKFLKYRPVLHNKKLKEEFGYTPRKTSEEVFDFYLKNRKFD
jgi:UDP-glucose 4-epimerase